MNYLRVVGKGENGLSWTGKVLHTYKRMTGQTVCDISVHDTYILLFYKNCVSLLSPLEDRLMDKNRVFDKIILHFHGL